MGRPLRPGIARQRGQIPDPRHPADQQHGQVIPQRSLPVCLRIAEQAKKVSLEQLSDTSATKVTLPFVEERLSEARALMGEDFWPYGVAANRKTLETFLHHHHSQGLSPRLVTVEELFHPGTLETFKL